MSKEEKKKLLICAVVVLIIFAFFYFGFSSFSFKIKSNTNNSENETIEDDYNSNSNKEKNNDYKNNYYNKDKNSQIKDDEQIKKSEDLNQKNNEKIVNNNDVTTRYEKIIRRIITISANVGGQIMSCNTTGEDRCNIILPDYTPKEGYEFIGWNTNKDAHTGIIAGQSYRISNGETLYPITRKEGVTYTVTFDGSGSGISSVGSNKLSCTIPAVYNDEVQNKSCDIILPFIKTNEGYSASGWSINPSETNGLESGSKVSIDKDTTFYANALGNSYTIEYYNGDKKLGSSNALVGENITLISSTMLDVSRDGYTFKGWDITSPSNNIVYSDEVIVNSLTLTDGDIIRLYAVYIDDIKPVCSFGTSTTLLTGDTTTLKLTCTDTGSGMDSQNLTSANFIVSNGNGQITGVSEPTKVENEYSWNVSVKGVSVGTFNVSLAENSIHDKSDNTNQSVTSNDITVNGKTYKATFVKQGQGVTEIGANSLSCTTTGSNTSCNIVLPSISINSGYTIVGWNEDLNSTNGTEINQEITLDSDKTYYAISYKDEITRTVTWNSNGATLVGGDSSCTIPVAYNNDVQEASCMVTAPTITRNEFEIVGFDTSATSTGKSLDSGATLTLSENSVYYAITSKKITVNFNGNGASVGSSSQSCTIWNSATTCSVTSPNITRDGYNIIGYNTNSNATTSIWDKQTAKAFSSNATYNAITSKVVTITFNANGATISKNKAECTMYNTKTSCNITAPTITRNGYIVIGFNTSSSATTSGWDAGRVKAVNSNTTWHAITAVPNANILAAYTYNQSSCKKGEESTCVATKCYTNKSSGSCPAGTIIRYKVNNSTIKYFYILHDDGDTITMQQRENTIEGVKWYSAEDYTRGPLIALPALENATSSWNNVNTINYTMGQTVFQTNAYTGCAGYGYCNANVYTLGQRSTKARMITAQETFAVGCNGTDGSCPRWMGNYLREATNYGGQINYGNDISYWTMNTSQMPNYVWAVGQGSSVYIVSPTASERGARAVVVINKK